VSKAIVTTSDINIIHYSDESTSSSTGVLEKILGDGHEVYVVTTRDKLCPTDDWWVKLVDSSKIFMGEPNYFEKGWHDLFKALGHEWPTVEDDTPGPYTPKWKRYFYKSAKGHEKVMQCPVFWTIAKDILKRKESYIWGEDVRFALN